MDLLPKKQIQGSRKDKTQEEDLTLTEKIKLKRENLIKFAYNQNSTDEEFQKIIEDYDDSIPYSISEALELVQPNISIYPLLNKYFNNYDLYYNKKIGPYILQYAKHNNPLSIPFSKVNRFKNNPYYNQGISNKEFNEIWKLLKKKYPQLKDSDQDLICQLYNIDQLKYEIGYNDDQSKSKITKSDKETGLLSNSIELKIPKTKGELYEYWYNLTLLYNQSENNILGNISSNNINDLLCDIKVIFLSFIPDKKDFEKRLLFSSNELFQNISKSLNSNQFIAINICNSINDTSNEIKAKCFENIFNKILETSLPKDCIIVPFDDETLHLLGCTNIEFYKYKKHVIYTKLSSDLQSLFDIINENIKKPSIKRTNNLTLESILTNIINFNNPIKDNVIENTSKCIQESLSNDALNNIQNIQLDDINSFQYSKKQYTFQELNQILKDLPDYRIMYISKALYNNQSGNCDKKGTPYIVLRKGLEKRFYYLDPVIDIGYSLNSDAKAEEPLDRLNIINNVSYKSIFKIKKEITDKAKEMLYVEPSFYNTDFAVSTIISSEIRNRQKYVENLNDKPRIAVIDFETEKNAIYVKPTDSTINAKCRLISYLDVTTKTVYCAVLRDNNYHKEIDLSNLTQHNGYQIIINKFYDEVDLWKWLNQKIYDLDPDIITGWNVEKFDLTYAIIRCKTLKIPFRNRYSDFQIIYTRKGEYLVGVDGCVILDYQKLYRACQMKKRENYKLEYICQLELKHGKRELIVNDHDEMYYNYLYEYVLYNLEDDMRIDELENKLNYIKFEFEMCNVCNISFDEIFSKTKLIDGLVYNYAWDNHKTLLKEGSRNSDSSSNNIKLIMLNDLRNYVIENNIDLFANNTISLRKIITETNITSSDSDKGYEGAVVLTPQSGIFNIVADLDASQMYPRLMIRSNIFKDTLCGVIAFDNENLAEKWLYDRDNFPSEILIKEHNKVNNKMLRITKIEFEEYLKDKILTPFGTIYWKSSVKRSLVSNILFTLINNRNKYKGLLKKELERLSILKEKYNNDLNNVEIIECIKLIERYDNLQMAYKSLINSFYGVMGMASYRLADIFSAATITASGRELTRMVSYHASKYMDMMIKYKDINIPFDKAPITVKTLIGLEEIENRKNILYGDTDSAFLWIGRVLDPLYGTNILLDEKVNKAWIIIDRISEYINQYVIRNILERKGIDFNDADKDYNYEYKKEIVMSKILLGEGKKQYALHMVMREGKRVDLIDIKGMLAIKSDTPRIARDLSNNIIEFILKEYDTENISKSNKILLDMYNNAIKNLDKMVDNGDLNIGSPVSITQDISNYATIQAGIRGMLIYDLIYPHEFRAGNKGYHYYIEKINWKAINMTPEILKQKFFERYGKYNWYEKVMRTMTDELFYDSITVPVDADNVDTNIFTIDKKRIIKNVIKDKVKDLLSLVGINRLDEDDDVKLRKTGIKKKNIKDILNNPMFQV